ncbi:MAG: flagellar basal body rod protein FlgB [Alphaproteobacteria bacterium]|nr:flagellar basal body rod protein FlgB [Alphaproteobacteria bacterium]
MSIQNATLMGMLNEKMSWAAQRQKVIAQNIANADTPKYQARDLKPLEFERTFGNVNSKVVLKTSRPGHLTSNRGEGTYDLARTGSSYEISPNGNRVILEEQMMRLNETNSDHKLAANIFKKYAQMYQTALRSQ